MSGVGVVKLKDRFTFWLVRRTMSWKAQSDKANDKPYRMTAIPCGPFDGETDRNAALAASLLWVTHTVTGCWAKPSAIDAAVETLTNLLEQ